MSEYNIQMNKYNALNAEYDQLYPVTKIEDVDGLDTALQNKAPAGYGLGGQSKFISSSDDLNDAVYDGWYCFEAPPINAPLLDGVNAIGYSSMLVSNRIPSLYVTQEIFCYNSWEAHNCVLRRCRINGEWKPWEWVDPPMIPGIEYRTTERWNGAPVYAQLFDCSPLPNATTKVFPVEGNYADNISVVVDYGGMSTYYGQSLQNKGFVSLNVTQSKISITTEVDYSAGNAYVWVKYVKSPS